MVALTMGTSRVTGGPTDWLENLMNNSRRISAIVLSAVLGLGILGFAAPANADTGWGRGGGWFIVH
jgi:hypothetical protein